ncbi:exodeoxyribonuclease V subunit beta [Corticibacter populi]|uniref:exodeoxyribonuclease V subunit beta n=1 Tax=Corticibacter populi TaxID=1550736 RepID=UPI0010CF6216|nr:exodeoxyribonuclease V subunit beta [Corticibacter populi]RZS30986.1 DNA helicase/exodeoxyribonuclease V beta subunit [Corticibacter populi]
MPSSATDHSPANTEPAVLDPLRLPLRGSRLIEASAGTGKTWTIAALYLRLVLGHGQATHTAHLRPLAPPDILVMTFTRAATQELSARIRTRLAEAADYFRGETEQADAFLQALREDYPSGPVRQQAAWRLAAAAEMMDEAAIHTIDAWCQRVLLGYASLTGTLGEEDLDGSTGSLQQLAAMDYWRQHVYPLEGAALDAVLALWPDAGAWLAASRALTLGPYQTPPTTLDAPDAGSQTLADVLQDTINRRDQTLQQLASGWAERAGALQQWLDAQTDKQGSEHPHWDGRRLSAKHYTTWLNQLHDWAADPQQWPSQLLTSKAPERLSPSGLQEARKADAPPLVLPPEIAAFQQLLRGLAELPDMTQAIRQHAAAHTLQRWRQLKTQQGVFDFADMLLRVQQALAGPLGPVLRQRLLQQYPVALIDEFQDTSPGQYTVFGRIYQPEVDDLAHALLLIGDPKQSIYRFRGADIDSYLAARRATQGRHYALTTNFRSSHAVVRAVNHVFLPSEQRPGSGAFRYRRPGDNPLPFVPVTAKGLDEALLLADEPLPALTVCSQAASQSGTDGNAAFAQHCAAQVVAWLGQPARFQPLTGDAGGPAQPLRPGHIAVLVRDRHEAALIQQALRVRGLASVYLSGRDSVFASAEAQGLVLWLQAVAHPLDVALARAAYATALLDLPLAELCAGVDDETALEQQLETLRQLNAIWQRQGVLPMLRQTIHRLDLAARWLAAGHGQGERKLTNVLHLAELLQQASTTLEGEQALIRWLVQQIHLATQGASGTDAEEQMVRLESDAQLIQIVTIHKSKGLEYPVVMLPFASRFRASQDEPATETDAAAPANAADTPPGNDEERLREDLRLLYVALTRARHALWVGFALNRHGNSKTTRLQRSALGYLLSGNADTPLEDAAWWAALQQWGQGCADVHITQAPAEADAIAWQDDAAPPALRDRGPYPGGFDQRYAIASFSTLTRSLQHEAQHGPDTIDTDDDDAPDAATPIEDAYLWQTPPRGAADEPFATEGPTATSPAPAGTVWHALPAGPRLGNFLHDQLERLGREGFPAEWSDTQRQRLLRQAELAGYGPQAQALLDWLQAIMATPMLPQSGDAPTAPRLGQLHRHLSEMEFWLPTGMLQASALDALCRTHYWPEHPRPRISERSWHGMLMGFADLVFEHQGRYWVLDYKSNRLGDGAASYAAPSLQQAVLHHRYDLQAMLYLLALHRLLKSRLPGYEPDRHLGGALYWFVRGIDHAGHGLIQLPAPAAMLAQLDAWLEPAPDASDASDAAQEPR